MGCSVAVGGGTLSLPTQAAELNLGDNTASVLTRPAPTGDYTVEKKLRFAPTASDQRAGLVLYGGDDRYFKLVHTVLPVAHTAGVLTHVTEFAEEGSRPPPHRRPSRPTARCGAAPRRTPCGCG
ncbi:hypothetical protein QQY24_02015 [Streptomyces sp. TG1A-8]|uniref:beta-xylosidase family glycoside hydrolase n=1 Tax=Streptomyces sp. TG1A-8 TaxID=3051385 RepID=UPI00265C3F9E|nr:hypothetical protein [Streptomyces sp. TG1A-8]MDO0924246.1 hypothetical protein [Streptomyces sp. TG1A-8]